MPAQRKTNQSRGLTAAGLIAVTAATLLMMAWAIFPTAAFAATKPISVNPSSLSAHACDANEWHFVITQIQDFNGDGTIDELDAPPSIHVTWANGASADVPLDGVNGHTADYTTTANLTSTVTGATANIDSTWSGTFNLSHGPCGTTTTPPTTTTTTPGGGGGGGTTTPPASTTPITTPPIVAPTTVHNTSTTATAEVLPTTVRPGKLAFTGIEDVVPIGALALTLMTTGSGLLWAGSRRRRHDGSEDED